MELTSSNIIVSIPYEYLLADVREALSPADSAQIRTVLWKLQDGADPVDAKPDELDMVVLPFHTVTQETTWQYVSTHGLGKVLARATKARLFQAPSIGVEGLAECIPEHADLANAVGVMEAPTAELAVTLLLSILREIPGFIRSGSEWDNHPTPGLIGKRVLLLGYGGVGKNVERMISGFRPKIVRVASRERILEGGLKVHAIDELLELLPEADAIVCTLPLNELTRGVISTEAFAAMKEGAAFVNIGRGAVVDAAALLAALDKKHIRVALDVTEPEPLPANHPLWAQKDVLITPHVGGNTDASHAFQRDLVVNQMRAILAGQTPINILS